MYIKTQPDISFVDFIRKVGPVATFNSVEGEGYTVKAIEGTIMKFTRKQTGKKWEMDLKGLYKAYNELKDFKTENFKPYVPFTHSPALGLLLHTGLLKR